MERNNFPISGERNFSIYIIYHLHGNKPKHIGKGKGKVIGKRDYFWKVKAQVETKLMLGLTSK